MRIPIYQVDAFTSSVFRGNPAAVCPLPAWIDDRLLQAIALENNLSETAYFVKQGDFYDLRWFTPVHEVDLCGHATLASAYVLTERLGVPVPLRFHTRSGVLTVTREDTRFALDFPSRPPHPCAAPAGLAEALGVDAVETFEGRDMVVVLESAEQVRTLQPRFDALAAVDAYAVVVTAAGDDVDFVSRFFAPRQGIDEDPVTGSSHCELIPMWAARLGKTAMTARQVSARGGELVVELRGDRVKIAGEATLYLEGQIEVE